MVNVKKNAKMSNTFLSQIFFLGPACFFVIVCVFAVKSHHKGAKAQGIRSGA